MGANSPWGETGIILEKNRGEDAGMGASQRGASQMGASQSTYLSKARYLFSEFNFSGAGSWYEAIITSESFKRVHAIINSSLHVIHDILSWTTNNHSRYSSLLAIWKQVSRDCQGLEFHLVILQTVILLHLSSLDEIRQF